MEHTVDYRLLDHFTDSRRQNRRETDKPLSWLEHLRAREAERQAEPPDATWRRVRALDLRD